MAERWWHTTHIFLYVDKEMIVTLYDFHHMTSLRCDGVVIDLEGELGTQLGINLLWRRYTIKTNCYLDIEANYRPLPQVTVDDCAKMARAFLAIPPRGISFHE